MGRLWERHPNIVFLRMCDLFSKSEVDHIRVGNMGISRAENVAH